MKSKQTRRALVMSLLSLLLCMSMLVGTTFAWFTDSVTSGQNKIIAGNLDVDVYYGDPAAKNSINNVATLFNDVTLWEPGAVAWENLTVVNLGTLALKYQLSVNFTDQNYVEGTNAKLSEALKVAVIEGGIDETLKREQVLTAAGEGTPLASFTKSGKLLPKDSTLVVEGAVKEAKTYGIVIWWEPSAEDNKWNVQNGAKTNDGKPLQIDLGINLVATQLEAEDDSFGTDYDKEATYPAVTAGEKVQGSALTLTAEEVVVTVPAAAEAGNYTLEVTNKTVSTDADGKTTVAFDINLLKDGVKVEADGSTKYTVNIEVGKNLDVSAVTHNGAAVSPFHYDPTVGVVTFETASFSPFAVTYKAADGDSVFVPEDPEAAESLKKEDVVAVDENGNEYATITAAVNSGASKLYFKEGADLGAITHLNVTNDLTIYGNGAKISSGERDFAIDIYAPLTSDITVTVYNLHGAAFWGSRTTDKKVTLNMYNCEDLGRIYLSGTTGENHINLINCTANKETLVGDTVVYSNANGKIVVDGCTFTNIGCPVNLNHKVAGEQTVTVKNSTFTDCATEGTAAYYAPIRLYNSVEGANQTLTTSGNTFAYSEGKAPINKADVLLNAKHDGVDAVGTIVATVEADATTVSGANVTLTHTVADKAELYAVAAFVNKHSNYEHPYENETVLLLNDINLNGEEWTPIGDYRFSANRFCGTFDGNGKTISNFKITKKTDKNDSNKSSYGFFGNLEGTVKNLTIDNAQVCSYAYVGALIGRLNGGTVENCHVKDSTVECTYWQAGGMIGQANDACTVKNSTVTSTTVTGASALGGLIGPTTLNAKDDVPSYSALVENCKVSGVDLVMKGGFGGNYDNYFGGIFGYVEVAADNRIDINNCVVTDTTIKGVASGLLSGDMDGEGIYVDGGKYLGNGISKGEGNTYYISNAEGMATLNNMMVNKTAGRDVVVNLTADIDMTGKTWTPVDSHADIAFELAEINGNGYTISNMTINGQAMFTRFAGTGDVVIKDITFDKATVNSNGNINTAILTVQTYQNVLLDNVDVKNSSITGGYKVAPLIATVYNESSSTITATLKNCDVADTVVTATSYDFCTTGMVAFVYADDNDKIEFENCSVSNVQIYAPNSYTAHAWIYTTGSETLFNEAEGVTVSGCTFENK